MASGTVRGGDGEPLDLSAATVVWQMADHRTPGTFEVSAGAVEFVTDGTDGQVRYEPTAADLDTPGLYFGNFKATFPDATVLYVPSVGSFVVHIQDPLGP